MMHSKFTILLLLPCIIFGFQIKSPCLQSSRNVIKNAVQFVKKSLALITSISILTATPSISSASLTYDISSEAYKNVYVNLPSDDFWYPPFMIGQWKTDLKFLEATFTDKISTDKLLSDGTLPGLSKYSVIFIPEIGEDGHDITMKYVQLDSHPREDHPYNIRQLIHAFSPTTIVDSAPYYFQKAPDWFHSPSNHWDITYHDKDGEGIIHLYTKKRDIQVFAGSVETFELFHQDHIRTDFVTKTTTTIPTDYAINWKLAVPAALRDEFINVQDLSKTDTILGNLNILVYLQPSNDLYNKIPSRPAGAFTYEVNMKRLDNGKNRIREDPIRDITRGNSGGVGSSSSNNVNTNNKYPRVRSTSASTIIIPKLNKDEKIDENNEIGRANPVYPFVWQKEGPIDNLEEYFQY